MEQNISSEVKSHSDTQEIPRLLWNPKDHYHVHKSPLLVPIPSQMHPIWSWNLRLVLPSCLLPFRLSSRSMVCISHLYHACCMPRHLILLDLIIRITFSESYILWSFSLWITLIHCVVKFIYTCISTGTIELMMSEETRLVFGTVLSSTIDWATDRRIWVSVWVSPVSPGKCRYSVAKRSLIWEKSIVTRSYPPSYYLIKLCPLFLTSCELLSCSKNSDFKEPENSSSRSQNPITGPYPEADIYSPHRGYQGLFLWG